MEQETIAKIIDTLKSEGIDLVVTLPEEPTSPLTETIRRDPYFTSVTVANENNGVALCAAASLGGRRCIFVTGIAGLLVGTWSLAQMGVLYGIPVLIMASYRGDISDRSGVSGAQLFMFQQLGEPMLLGHCADSRQGTAPVKTIAVCNYCIMQLRRRVTSR